MIDNQDAMLADAFATLSEEVEAPHAMPVQSPTRRTVIVDEGEAQRFSVRVDGYPTIEVEACGAGNAVLAALETAERDALAYYGGAIFLWSYDLIDESGNVLRGSDPRVRDSVERARIARS